MKNDQLAFGIDIGGTNTKIGLFDHTGELKSYLKIPTLKSESADEFIDQITRECSTILRKDFSLELGDPRIVGVGIGAPMANYYTGLIPHAPNIGWKNVPLRDLFQRKFKTTAVIENDANLAAVGEKKWGVGKEFSNFVLITLGTGVGSGLILDGKLFRGHDALGAEGGHMVIPTEKKRSCSCGGVNHLESFLSANGIKQTIHELTGEDWTIEKLGIDFRNGDAKATMIINRIAEELSYGLNNMAVLLGPEAFIIGGGVSKLGESFNNVILKKLDEIVHFSMKGKIQILSAQLSTDKGAIYGGAAHVIDEVFHR